MCKEFKLNEDAIDIDNINPTVRKILGDVIIPRSRTSYNIDFAVQAINSSFAHFATMARLRYIPSNGNKSNFKMTTYYAMSFLSSGKGKDFITDLIERELFDKLTNGFDKLLHTKAILYNNSMREKMDEWLENGCTNEGIPYGKKEYNEDIKSKFMPTTPENIGLRFGQATPEGLAYARNRIEKVNIGSPYLKIPEFSSALSNSNTKELFTSLIELWEDGNMSPKTTKGSLLPSSRNVPILFNAYTDPNKIMNDVKKQKSLVEEFSSGMGRRTFVVFPEEEDFIKKKEKSIHSVDTNIKDEITTPILEGIKKFFDMKYSDDFEYPIQYFSDDAKDYMEEVNKICVEKEEELRGHLTDGELANIVSMSAKIEKLASVYAFIDGRIVISEDDCRYATYWASYTSKYLGKISRVLTPPERLYRMMDRKRDWISGMEIEQAGIFDKSFDFNKKLDSTLQNLSQFCSMNNADLIVSQRDGGAIIRTKKIPLVDLNELRTSALIGKHEDIKLRSDGWNGYTFSFDTLHNFLCGDYEAGITSCEFSNGIRKDTEATGKIYMIVLDFDNGTPTWDEALDTYSQYTYFAYKTRSHQKDKNGIKCDRFRIILPLERMLDVSVSQYKSMYTKMLRIVAPTADEQCKNIGRIFFNNPNSDFVYNDGSMFKAHYFLEDSKTEKVYSTRTKLDGSGLKNYFLSEIDIVNSSRTGGVNLLVKACYATKDSMHMSSKEEAKSWILELSKLIFDDYWKRHSLEKEVLGVLEKIW